MKKNITLEEALKRLQQITDIMQEKELSVDESLALFEEGTALVKLSREKLEKAEMKITELNYGKEV